MKSKPNKNLNVKIVLLKQPVQNKSFYASSQINEELRRRVSLNDRSKNHHKHTSIAYLSSIIQDDKHIDEDNNYSFDEATDDEYSNNKKYSAAFQDQRQLFKLLRPRESGRQLSCLVQNSQHRNKIYRSKTEGIDKVIEERKLMPINRLKVGSKNIKFSSKNKQELTKDFNEFILNKEMNFDILKENSERDNVLYQKRRMEYEPPRKSTLWLTSIQNEAKNQKSCSQQQECSIKSISPKKARREEQPKYASYLKKLKSNIPQIDHFGWSKLNKTLFRLKPQ